MKNITLSALFVSASIALFSLTACSGSVEPAPTTDEPVERESSPLQKERNPTGSTCGEGESYCCVACKGGGRICMCVAACPGDMPLC